MNPEWTSIDAFLDFWLKDNPLTGEDRVVFDRYYTGYRQNFSPYVRHHFANQSREIVSEIRSRDSPRVLEVGAGCGTESLWFSLNGANVTAIDIATDRLSVARARLAWLNSRLQSPLDAAYVEASLFEFEPDKPFDIIWLEQAFHHLEPRVQVYERLAHLLAPNGTVIISECNAWNPPMQLQLFLRRGFRTRTHFVDPRGRRIEYGNERITTPGALSRGLEKVGLTVREIRPFRMLPNSNPPASWLAVERTLVSSLPFLATHFNIVATKGDGPASE